MAEDTVWLTPAAHDKLKIELEELLGNGRRQMEERLSEARSHGDIRENADYDVAKDEQAMMEAYSPAPAHPRHRRGARCRGHRHRAGRLGGDRGRRRR